MGTMRLLLLAAVCICAVLGMAGFPVVAYGESAVGQMESLAPAPITFNGSGMQLSPVNDNRLWVAEGEEAAPTVGATAPLHRGIAADEDVAAESSKPLSITVKGDWVSKYMFRGVDVLDDRGAYQPSVDIGLDCGLHFNVWGSFASSGRFTRGAVHFNGELEQAFDHDSGYPGTDQLDEFDYTVYYTKSCLDGCLATEVGMTYYDLFRQSSEALDFWEWYGKFTLSKMPLQPHAYFYYALPKNTSNGAEGWMTCLGGSHTCELGAFPCFGSPDPMSLTFTGDLWYNGGAYYYGVDTGFTHAVFGSALTIPLCNNISFTPGVYYQLSMEDTINEDDEWWTQLSLAYTW